MVQLFFLLLLTLTGKNIWCKTEWFEYLRNCSPGIFMHKSLEFAENGAGKNTLLMRGQRRRAILIEADRKVTVTQITTHYNNDIQSSIAAHNKNKSNIINN